MPIHSSPRGVARPFLIALFACASLASALYAQSAPPAPPAPPVAPAPPASPASSPAPAAPEAQARSKPQGVIRHGVTQAPAKPAGAIRVAAYNIENLFAPGAEGRMADQKSRGTMPKPDAHMKAVADAIRAVDADVLALQEIESLETLTTFRDTYLNDMGYTHISSLDAGDDRGIEQSVLSRFPITQAKNWLHLPLGGTHPANRKDSDRVAGGPIQFKRSPLLTTIQLPASKDAPAGAPETKPQTLTLFNVHFKSGGRADGYWREREADKTAALANEFLSADPAAAVIILGDFNARPQERAFKFISGAGFVDAFGDLPDGDPKFITHSSDRVIDHLMLSPRAAAGLIKDTRFVFGTINRPAGVDWRTTDAPDGWASDHYPVVIDLDPAKMNSWTAAAPESPAAPAGEKK